MNLAFDDHWVQHHADIVDCGVGDEGEIAGLRIDLDLGDMAAARKGEIDRIEEGGLLEAGLQDVERKAVRRKIGCAGDLAECHAAVGAADRELAGGEFDIMFVGLEKVAGDLSALVDDLADSLGNGGTADGGRTRTIGAEAERAAGGIAVDDLNKAARYAEHIADDLGENRLMALAVIMRAGEDGDVAGGIDADRGAFEQTAARAELTRDT